MNFYEQALELHGETVTYLPTHNPLSNGQHHRVKYILPYCEVYNSEK